MIVFHILILTFYLLFGQIQNESNIGQNYDTNDWIPIEPTNRRSDNQQVAQGRVLNLETPPNQRFFPDEDYLRKQHHHHQQQQQQQQQQKSHRPTRVQHPYRFETVVAPPPPPPPTRQLQQQSLSQVLVAPPPTDENQPNLYESLNPGVINHELLPQLPLITTLRTPTTPPTTRRSRPNVDNKENVQLLYVPLENLRKNQQVGQQSQNYYHQTQLPVRFNEEIQKNRPQLLENIQQDFIQQALAAHKLQQQLQQQPQELPQIVSSLPPLPPPVTTTTTTTTIPPKPKKRKPHQPPLAVYMEKLGSAEINDVLRILKNAKSITVQDSITQQSPQVFVGPYNLNPPEGYTKFPLPYISNVDGNRIERHRIEDLPFFVAPLSYRAPDGYSKIPLPSPHVGSVIVKQNGETIQAQIITTTSPKNFVGSPQIDPKIQQQFLPVFQEIKPNLQENPREYLPKYQQKPVETSTLNYEKYPQINNYEIETLPIHRFSPTTTPPTTTTTTTTEKQIMTTSNQPESRDFVPFQPQNQYRLEVNPQQINHGFSQYELEQINRFIAENPEYHVSSVSSNLPTQSSPNAQQFVAETPEFYPNPASVSTSPPPPPRFVGENSQLHHLNPISGSTLPSTPNRLVAETPEFQQSPISGSTLRPLALTSVVNTENYEIVTKSRSKSTPPPQFLAETPAIHSDPIAGTRIRLESHPSTLEVGGNYENRPSTPPSSHRFLTETPQFQQSPISGSTLRPISRPTTSTTIGSDDYEIVTKPRNRSRKRQRGRPSTRTTTTTTTLRPVTGFDNEHYTVLEEFNIKPQIITTTTTPKYTTEIETVPANVYKLEPVVFQQQPQQQQQELTHHHYQQQQELNHHHYQQQQQQPEIITDGPHYSPLIYNRGQIAGTTPTTSNNYQLIGLLNDIQDQSVKSLLNPKLLIPTTEPIHIPTTTTTTTTTPEPVIITTTTRRSRGRQRITTTATPHRRVVNRRRPTRLTTTTTERPTTDFESSRAVSRQRFRTRGRPLTTEIPKNTQIFDNHHQQQQQQQQSINFQEVSPQIEPQSYMQFEHTVNDEEVIKVKVDGDRDDHDNVDNVKLISEIEQSQPVIDVQINHPIDDGAVKFVETTEKQPQTIQSGGVYHNHKYHQEDNERLAVLQPTRGNGNGRLRSRSRIVQTTPTTTTTTSTTMTTIRLENQNQKEEEEKEEDEEFYGFIRPPNYNKPSSLILTTTQQQQQEPRFSIEGEQSSPTPSSVRFIGEIRPKYLTTPTPTTITPGNFDEQFTVKSRSRIRIPQRRLNPQFNEIQTTPITTTRRISNIGRGRNRGHTYYQSPLSSSGEDFNQNDSVEGGNYPMSYLKSHSFPPQTTTTTTTTTTATTEKPAFQITIDPDGYTVVGEENEEDQEINPSLYRPKWVQASAQALQHDEIIDETQNTTTTKKAPNYRRKGVWKLVKKQPIEDQFEVAESQNYQSVLNLFDEITKISTTTPTTTIEPTTTTTTTESSLFDTIYNMFSDLNKSQQANNETTSTADDNVVDKIETTTTTITPTFPEEITEATTLTELPETTTTTTTQNSGQKYEVEPWEMKEVKTSTSTEISHETEICYKGRCVKTKDKN